MRYIPERERQHADSLVEAGRAQQPESWDFTQSFQRVGCQLRLMLGHVVHAQCLEAVHCGVQRDSGAIVIGPTLQVLDPPLASATGAESKASTSWT